MILPHSRPTLGNAEQSAVRSVIASGQLAQGPVVQKLETHLARICGRKYGVAVSSGTAALELALRVLKVGAGDAVIMPSYVCTALLLAARRVGAAPVLADIDPDTLNLSPESCKTVLSRKVRAIILPHLFGRAAHVVI